MIGKTIIYKVTFQNGEMVQVCVAEELSESEINSRAYGAVAEKTNNRISTIEKTEEAVDEFG